MSTEPSTDVGHQVQLHSKVLVVLGQLLVGLHVSWSPEEENVQATGKALQYV